MGSKNQENTHQNAVTTEVFAGTIEGVARGPVWRRDTVRAFGSKPWPEVIRQ